MFSAVLYHLEQIDQYSDINKRALLRKDKVIFSLQLWLTWLQQNMETVVKEIIEHFNLTVLELHCKTPQHDFRPKQQTLHRNHSWTTQFSPDLLSIRKVKKEI